MKFRMLTLILCSLTVGSIAQTTKGTISLGGAVSFSKSTSPTTDGDVESSQFSISPKAGYFLADGMELGLSLAFSSAKSESDGNEGPTTNETAIGPYFKYYMYTSNEDFAFTLNAELLFGSTKTSFPGDGIDDQKGSNISFAISPGFSYFFTDKIGLDFQLRGIVFGKSDPNKDIHDNETTFFELGASSLSPSLGFRYFISR